MVALERIERNNIMLIDTHAVPHNTYPLISFSIQIYLIIAFL
jgi:hypothetical protein